MTRRNSAARSKAQYQRQAKQAAIEGRYAGRGLLAAELVRDWTPEQRDRIRNDPLTPGELAELIDKIIEEER